MRKTSGFSMLEVLIATCILSFCLLGIAAMQITLLQRDQDAYLRSLAISQVTSMVESRLSGDADCSLWQIANARLLPHAESKCMTKISLCWQGRIFGKECVSI